jgi:hypothetical protein
MKLTFDLEWLLRKLVEAKVAEAIAGDIQERFIRNCRRLGGFAATLEWWADFLTTVWALAWENYLRPMPKPFAFTLHEDAWLRDGSIARGGQVTGYKVGGMSDGKTARIANFGAPNYNDWQIMRIYADNSQDEWTGSYDSAQEALVILERD